LNQFDKDDLRAPACPNRAGKGENPKFKNADFLGLLHSLREHFATPDEVINELECDDSTLAPAFKKAVPQYTGPNTRCHLSLKENIYRYWDTSKGFHTKKVSSVFDMGVDSSRSVVVQQLINHANPVLGRLGKLFEKSGLPWPLVSEIANEMLFRQQKNDVTKVEVMSMLASKSVLVLPGGIASIAAT
jgi:hypothetical protein